MPRALGYQGHSVAQGAWSPPGHLVSQDTWCPRALGRPGHMVAQGLRLPRALGNPGHSVAQGNRSPRALGRPGHTVAQETESPMALGRPGPRLPFPEHKNKYFATLGVCTIITYKCLTLFNIYFHILTEGMWYVVVIQINMSFLHHNLIFSIGYFKRGFYFLKY